MMKVEIRIYKEMKYEAAEAVARVHYNINNFSVMTGEAAEKIEAATDGSCIDEYHEYLVLELADGDTATFRNSHVDMFLA